MNSSLFSLEILLLYLDVVNKHVVSRQCEVWSNNIKKSCYGVWRIEGCRLLVYFLRGWLNFCRLGLWWRSFGLLFRLSFWGFVFGFRDFFLFLRFDGFLYLLSLLSLSFCCFICFNLQFFCLLSFELSVLGSLLCRLGRFFRNLLSLVSFKLSDFLVPFCFFKELIFSLLNKSLLCDRHQNLSSYRTVHRVKSIFIELVVCRLPRFLVSKRL